MLLRTALVGLAVFMLTELFTTHPPASVAPDMATISPRQQSRGVITGPAMPCTFSVPPAPGVVGETSTTIDWRNSPVSEFRPQRQFCHPNGRPAAHEKVVLTVITATWNPGESLLATYRMVTQQSLSSIRWIVIDDHTTEQDSLDRLEFISRHPKVFVRRNTREARGLPVARNVALELIHSEMPTTYWALLDDDDVLELTAYEKLVWALESARTLDIASYHVVNHGARNYLEEPSFANGDRVYENSIIPVASVVRSSITRAHRFDETLTGGMEDWDYWLGLIEDGAWGLTVPEYLLWYKTTDLAIRRQRWPNLFEMERRTQLYIRRRHTYVGLHGVPDYKAPRQDNNLESAVWVPPFDNVLFQPPHVRRLLIVLPLANRGGVETVFYRLVKMLAQSGRWKVTVVVAMHRPPLSNEMRPAFMRYTHDFFTLPTFLLPSDYPRFLAYLIRSRGVGVVMISNALLGYQLLPMLQPMFPTVRFVDMVHSVLESWRDGGFPAMSARNAKHIHLTLAVSQQLADWVLRRQAERPPPPEYAHLPAVDRRVVSFYVGVNVAAWWQSGPTPTAAAASVVQVCRLSSNKRPVLGVRAMAAGVQRAAVSAGQPPVPVEVVGDGALEPEVTAATGTAPVPVTLHGSLQPQEVRSVVERAQLVVLASSVEGTPGVIAEAMAMGVPVIVFDAGAVQEMVGDAAFRVLPLSGSDSTDEAALAEAIAEYIMLPLHVKQEWGARARARMVEVFDTSKTLQAVSQHLEEQWEAHSRAARGDVAVPSPVARLSPDPTLYASVQHFRKSYRGDLVGFGSGNDPSPWRPFVLAAWLLLGLLPACLLVHRLGMRRAWDLLVALGVEGVTSPTSAGSSRVPV